MGYHVFVHDNGEIRVLLSDEIVILSSYGVERFSYNLLRYDVLENYRKSLQWQEFVAG